MIISEDYKGRIKKLAGLVQEDIALSANSGRSDAGSLSWYVEEYLLRLGSDILNELDSMIEQEQSMVLSVSRSSTKIMSNSMVVKLFVDGSFNNIRVKEEILLTLSVNLETDSNTVVAVNVRGIINKINLSSKHSGDDLSRFRTEVVNNILNSVKLSTKK